MLAIVVAAAWTDGLPLLVALGVGLLILISSRIERLVTGLPVAGRVCDVAVDRNLLKTVDGIIDAAALSTLAHDPIHRELTTAFFRRCEIEADAVARGTIRFESTEEWRLYYEKLIQSPGLHTYRSVSLIRDLSYWQSEAGRKSFQLNIRLSESRQVTIQRIAVLADELWTDANALPAQQIQEWLVEQHHSEISLWLIRETELAAEPELTVDMGIYGSRATGIQELDESGGTRHFTLKFGFEHVEAAEEKWNRLMVYAVKYSDFLDRYSLSS